jgi:spore germination protein (amino acid permease)
MSVHINERFLVSPFLAFFIIHSIQFGLGYLSFQRGLVQIVGQDAWVAVLITGISFHIVIWMMYQILDTHQGDLVYIHRKLLGKWMGGLLSIFFIAYLLLLGSTVLRTFIELVQVWVFPELKTWVLGLVLLVLAYYIVLGGFRVIVGVCFFSLLNYILFSTYALFTKDFHFSNLTPILQHSIMDIVKSTKHMAYSYLGVEILLICYPFIKTPSKSKKWVYFANIATTILYLITVILTLAFCTQKQIIKEFWPTLAFFRNVQLPTFERFEFIGISFQLLRVFPILSLSLWAASRATKLLFTVKQYAVIPVFLLVIFIIICLMPDHRSINAVSSFVSTAGLYLVYIYIPFLYILHILRKEVGSLT